MKKITLFIAFLAISIGAVWGDVISIPGTQTDGRDDTDANVPFNVKSSPQTIHILYKNSNFSGFTYNSNKRIAGLKFFASSSLPDDLSSLTFTIELQQVSSSTTFPINNNFTKVFEGKVKTNNSDNDKSIEFNFDGGNYFSYDYSQLSNYDLAVKITVTGSFSGSSVNWFVNNNDGSVGESYTNNNMSLVPKTDFIVHEKQSVEVGGNTYYVYNVDGQYHAVLTQFASNKGSSVTSEGKWLYTFSNDQNGTNVSATSVEEYERYIISENLPAGVITGASSNITVTGIGNGAFNSFTASNDVAIELPGGVHTIGDNSLTDNKCFNCTTNGHEVSFIITRSGGEHGENKTKIVGTNLSTLGGTNINLYYRYTAAEPPLSNTETFSFSQRGWVSHAYQINLRDIYGKITESIFTKKTSTNANSNANDLKYDFIEIEDVPFRPNCNHVLKLKLKENVAYAHNDGSNYIFNKFTTSCQAFDGVSFEGNGSNEIIASKAHTQAGVYNIYVDGYSFLKYGQGDPYVDYEQAISFKNADAGEYNMFNNADSLVFVYENEENVPYWEYTDNQNVSDRTPYDFCTTDVDIHIHKKVSSDKYRYFSFPCSIPVCSIEVKNDNTGEIIPLMTADYNDPTNKAGYDSSKDYFLILKYAGQTDTWYKGQSNEEAGHAHYDQVTTTGSLLPNQAYAFAIFESDANYIAGNAVIADVIFKSGTDPKQLYRSDCNQTISGLTCTGVENKTVDYSVPNNSNYYKGWNMIGNPNYCYLDAKAIGEYVTTIDEDGVGYTHYYFGTGTSTESEKVVIKPFEAFLVQVAENQESITMNFPNGYKSPNPYGSHSVGTTPQLLPAALVEEVPEINEVVYVRLEDANGNYDRTGIINDEFATEEFQLGQDLGKFCNTWSQIYSYCDQNNCAFKKLNLRQDSSRVIPLGLRVAENGNHKFALDSLNLFYGQVILHDKQEGQYYPLNHEGVSVNLTAGTDTSRFELVIIAEDIPAELDAPVETSESLDAYVYNGRLVVENIEEGSTLSIFDVSGRMLYTAPAAGDFNYQFSAHGVYMVVLQGNTTGSIKVVY